MTTAGQLAATPGTAGRRQRLTAPLVTIGALAATTVALHVRDPHASGSWGYCPSRVLFGVSCPGCGGLRAVNDLTHGDLLAAASSNLLFVASIPLVVWVLGRWLVGAWTGVPYRPRWVATRAFSVLSLVLLVGFTVLRNIPAGAWLAP
ncbi:MAG: DUF2752 domain-containing protein [Nocardioidaceae bacterium]